MEEKQKEKYIFQKPREEIISQKQGVLYRVSPNNKGSYGWIIDNKSKNYTFGQYDKKNQLTGLGFKEQNGSMEIGIFNENVFNSGIKIIIQTPEIGNKYILVSELEQNSIEDQELKNKINIFYDSFSIPLNEDDLQKYDNNVKYAENLKEFSKENLQQYFPKLDFNFNNQDLYVQIMQPPKKPSCGIFSCFSSQEKRKK